MATNRSPITGKKLIAAALGSLTCAALMSGKIPIFPRHPDAPSAAFLNQEFDALPRWAQDAVSTERQYIDNGGPVGVAQRFTSAASPAELQATYRTALLNAGWVPAGNVGAKPVRTRVHRYCRSGLSLRVEAKPKDLKGSVYRLAMFWTSEHDSSHYCRK